MKNIHCVKSVQILNFSWSVFSRIRTENGDFRSKSPYSVRIREVRTRKNSLLGRFSRSDHSWGNFSFFLSYVFPWSVRYFFSFLVWYAQLTAFQGNFVQYYLKIGIWWKVCIMLRFYFLMCFTSLANWYVETWLSPSKKNY